MWNSTCVNCEAKWPYRYWIPKKPPNKQTPPKIELGLRVTQFFRHIFSPWDYLIIAALWHLDISNNLFNLLYAEITSIFSPLDKKNKALDLTSSVSCLVDLR